jgi:two-component system OmpR family sensor kinase
MTITVRDRGVGIPPDELLHIFTPRYRASTSMGIAGTGLSLAGAKTIVEQHGGHIRVDSAMGQGTTVTVWLPRTRGRAYGAAP